jgi:hypothetical protein
VSLPQVPAEFRVGDELFRPVRALTALPAETC